VAGLRRAGLRLGKQYLGLEAQRELKEQGATPASMPSMRRPAPEVRSKSNIMIRSALGFTAL
jgi:hypothetical protein